MKLFILSPVVLAVIGVVLTNFFWSTNIIVSRGIHELIPPISLNFWRWSAAALCLLPFVLRDIPRYWPLFIANWKWLLLFGFLSVSCYNALLYSASHSTLGINIAVINTMIPLFTFLLNALLFNVRPSRIQLAGLLIGFAGVLVLIFQGSLWNVFQLNLVRGDVWMLLAALCWAAYTVLLRKKPAELPLLIFLFINIVLGLLLMFIPMLVELNVRGSFELKGDLLVIFIYLGIFPSLLAYWFWNNAVDKLGANSTTLFMYVMPVFTAFLGIIIHQEPLSWFHIVGQLLIFAGFYFSVFKGLRYT